MTTEATYFEPPVPHWCEWCEGRDNTDEWACWERMVDAAEDDRLAALAAAGATQQLPSAHLCSGTCCAKCHCEGGPPPQGW
jgi:hypothetical protein